MGKSRSGGNSHGVVSRLASHVSRQNRVMAEPLLHPAVRVKSNLNCFSLEDMRRETRDERVTEEDKTSDGFKCLPCNNYELCIMNYALVQFDHFKL